jgi:hypothetical protein
MWLSYERLAGMLAEYGLGERAGAGDRAGERERAGARERGLCQFDLDLSIEPITPGIRVSLRAGPAAASLDVDFRDGVWEAHARELLVRCGLRACLGSAAPAVVRLWDAFRDHELLRLEAALSAGPSSARVTTARALADENAEFRNDRLARLLAPARRR